MRNYELMVIFPLEEDLFKPALDAAKAVLGDFGAEIISEEPYGDRDLCYPIKKRNRGRYVLFNIKANPAKIIDIDRQFKLNQNMLRFLFVHVEEKKA